MSRAYCLTCNEHVHETPSGTCPLGHPVAADGYGPEPWVGFAGDTETDVAEVQMHHLDTHGRPREHAGVGQQRNGTPHVNGTVNGSATGSPNGHVGSLASSSVAFPSVNGGDGPTPNDLASDDLTALLAEALRDNAAEEQVPAPVEEARAPADDPAPASHDDDADWSELASLAAELHLDEEVATDDGPGAPAPPTSAPLPPHSSAADTPEGELSAGSIDDLLAELTGGTSDAAPTAADAPVEPPHAPEPPVAPPVAPPPPPPAVPVDDTMARDVPPSPDDVGSAPTADPVDVWAEPAPAEEPAPVEETTAAPTVDLYNFTARGKRVGDTGSALPTRKKKRGRKR